MLQSYNMKEGVSGVLAGIAVAGIAVVAAEADIVRAEDVDPVVLDQMRQFDEGASADYLPANQARESGHLLDEEMSLDLPLALEQKQQQQEDADYGWLVPLGLTVIALGIGAKFVFGDNPYEDDDDEQEGLRVTLVVDTRTGRMYEYEDASGGGRLPRHFKLADKYETRTRQTDEEWLGDGVGDISGFSANRALGVQGSPQIFERTYTPLHAKAQNKGLEDRRRNLSTGWRHLRGKSANIFEKEIEDLTNQIAENKRIAHYWDKGRGKGVRVARKKHDRYGRPKR